MIHQVDILTQVRVANSFRKILYSDISHNNVIILTEKVVYTLSNSLIFNSLFLLTLF